MFSEAEIQNEFLNLPNRRLLHFGQSIINLEHVSEILRSDGERKIVFYFTNGRRRAYPYETQSSYSFALHILDHCIEKNLLRLKLTPACYAKWEGYRVAEIDKTRS